VYTVDKPLVGLVQAQVEGRKAVEIGALVQGFKLRRKTNLT
jgi:hypothetical protein